MSNKKEFILKPGNLQLDDLRYLMHGGYNLVLDSECIDKIAASRYFLEHEINKGNKIYGVNTGFGLLANKTIEKEDLTKLQHNLIVSHATGVGQYLIPEIVRIILILKINCLSMGYSGVRLGTILELIDLYNQDIIPCIPEKGSVGASGDLAPLAHLVSPLIGYGNVYYQSQMINAEEWLKMTNKNIYKFEAKEGLALLNGTQVTTALAIYSVLQLDQLFACAIHTGAMSVDAASGNKKSFVDLISIVRNQPGQIKVAAQLYDLLSDSQFVNAHDNACCPKVQDPYSLRCQPQVMGACLQQIEFATSIIANEINAVTDNPLIFAATETILFGGNFHAEPIGFAVDNLALAIAEIGSISERRIALLLDTNFSGLPTFLVKNSGLNSGFMIAQVTAASLVSENKALSTPCVVDSIPTSANQEDHVSMATYGARRLITMIENAFVILAIELLSAAQGIELRRPHQSSVRLEKIISALRCKVDFYEHDRYFHTDIVSAIAFVKHYDYND